jgi:hypothetical protein
MFAFQSSRNAPRFSKAYGGSSIPASPYTFSTDPLAPGSTAGGGASTTGTGKKGINITEQQGLKGIEKIGDLATSIVDAYKDINIAKITGQAPTKAPSITAGGGVGGTGLRTAGGGRGGGKGLSTGAIVGISAGAIAVLGVVGYFVFKKK